MKKKSSLQALSVFLFMCLTLTIDLLFQCLTMHKQPWLVVLRSLHHDVWVRERVCVVVSHVRSHSQQLDVIVAPHRAVCRASRSPQGSNDIVKEGGGDGGGLWKTLKSLMINAIMESLQVSNVCAAPAVWMQCLIPGLYFRIGPLFEGTVQHKPQRIDSCH